MTSPMPDGTGVFSFNGFTLFDAIDALMAYDVGACDSGTNDEAMREAVKGYLRSLSRDQLRRTCAFFARGYLTDKAIDEGHGVEDVAQFVGWLEEML